MRKLVYGAIKYQNTFYTQFKLAAKNPEIAEVYPYSKYTYRKLKVNRHLVFYRVTENELIIVRILHERMNFRSVL